jgi:hypothetical protein
MKQAVSQRSVRMKRIINSTTPPTMLSRQNTIAAPSIGRGAGR